MKTDKEIAIDFNKKYGKLSPKEEKEIKDKLLKKAIKKAIKEGKKGAAELKERFDT